MCCPGTLAVPIDARGHDVADRAVLQALDRFDVAELVVALQADADGQVLLLRFFGGGQKRGACPGASVATGFSMNTCLPALHGGLEMNRTEAGRRGENHQVDIGGDRFFVGIESPVNFRSSGTSIRSLCCRIN